VDRTPPRGTQDFLPPASDRLLALYDAAHRAATSFGYRYVETPTFESTDLFARSSGETSDVVSKEMYTFEDRGGRSVTLRPEGTAPVVRAYLANAHDLPTPFKGYYVETLFRYGRPQKGRLREFRTFGVEVLGAHEPQADVDVIEVGSLLLDVLRGGGPALDGVELQLNSIGDETCRPAYRELLIGYLERNQSRLRDEHRDRFRENPLRVLDCKDDACREVSKEAPLIVDHLCEACAAHFTAVKGGLDEAGIAYTLTPTLVRGLDYYTRTAFEFVSPSLGPSQGTIIGGGRYDGLAEALGGPATPGVGFGSGIERLLLALGETWDPRLAAAWVGRHPGLWFFVVAVGEETASYARAVARGLRGRRGAYSVDGSFAARPLKAQLRMADRAGAAFTVVVGEREREAETVTLKRMHDGTEVRDVTLQGALDWIGEDYARHRGDLAIRGGTEEGAGDG
jgi:histidyl-tRNA synthetase